MSAARLVKLWLFMAIAIYFFLISLIKSQKSCDGGDRQFMMPMPLFNKIVNSLSQDVLNGTGEKISKFLFGAVMIAFISSIAILAVILVFICITLLIQSYTTGGISHQRTIFSFLDITEIEEFRYRCWLMLGLISVNSPLALPVLIKDLHKLVRYQYLLFFICCVILSWSIHLGISRDYLSFTSEQSWGELSLLIGVAGSVFCDVEEKNNRWQIYFSILLLAGLIVQGYYI